MRRKSRRPTQLKKFAGKHINLHAIERHHGLTRTYLSRIFFGSVIDGVLTFRSPSIDYATKIALALEMPVGTFLALLDVHHLTLKRQFFDKKHPIPKSSVA